MEIKGIDGTVRQDYYGAGRQPWDDIKLAGWAPAFAAGNVLKYLRRPMKSSASYAQKEQRAEDLKKARWYWAELLKLRATHVAADFIAEQLRFLLTNAERDELNAEG